QSRGSDADAEGSGLDLHGIGAHEAERSLILRDGHDGAPVERPAEKEIEGQRHGHADDARHQISKRDADAAELERLADVARLHQPIVDAELKAEADLYDEENAEEEHEPAQRFLAPPLEAGVVDAIDDGTEHVEHRREEDAGEDGIE